MNVSMCRSKIPSHIHLLIFISHVFRVQHTQMKWPCHCSISGGDCVSLKKGILTTLVCSHTFHMPTKLVAPILEEWAASATIRWEPEGNVNEWGGLGSNVTVTFFLLSPPPPLFSFSFFKRVLLQGSLLRNIFYSVCSCPHLSLCLLFSIYNVSLCCSYSPPVCPVLSLSAPETKNCSSLLYFSSPSSSSSVTQSETFPPSVRQSARIPIDQSPRSSHYPDHVILSATHTHTLHMYSDTYHHTRRQEDTYTSIWLHRQTVIASPSPHAYNYSHAFARTHLSPKPHNRDSAHTECISTSCAATHPHSCLPFQSICTLKRVLPSPLLFLGPQLLFH